MSNKTVKILHRAATVALSVTAVLCAVALAVACVQIYQSGERPFSPQSIAGAWSDIAIFVWLFVVCVIGSGLLFWLFPAPEAKQKAKVCPHVRLSKARARLARKQYDPRLLSPLEKHDIYLVTMRGSAVLVCILSAVPSLFYLSNVDNFTSIDTGLNAQIIRGVVPALLAALIALGFCAAVKLLSDVSAERALVYAKAIMLLPAPAAEKKAVGKACKDVPGYAIIVVRVALILVAVLMIVFGIFNGGMNDVLQKAIMICTECIGLG